jgi:hypothetical protein
LVLISDIAKLLDVGVHLCPLTQHAFQSILGGTGGSGRAKPVCLLVICGNVFDED